MDLSQRRELTQSVSRSSGSYELVFAAVLFSLLGVLVDAWVGLFPLFTVIFALAGFAGASVSVFFQYRHSMAVEAERRSELAGRGRVA